MVAAEVSPTILKERGKFSAQYRTYIFPFHLIHPDQINESLVIGRYETFMIMLQYFTNCRQQSY